MPRLEVTPPLGESELAVLEEVLSSTELLFDATPAAYRSAWWRRAQHESTQRESTQRESILRESTQRESILREAIENDLRQTR
ncbi:MAG: hypothetical protein E6G28_11130 [Actinobacteria bacterium]|nr:MAG: hypothetical protein E6G28_11130 [Actinomycetota bacterium]